jgi:hypothetical protein
MSLLAASTPPVTKEFFDKLLVAFPRLSPQPNVHTMDDVMYSAGHQEVIEWIRVHALRDQIVTGKADVSQSVNVRQR